MNKINYSIIVPTHNSSGYIKRLLESIPNRKDVEILVIDDHSNDIVEMKRMINKFSSVELISNHKSKGAGNARQVGLDISRGKWVLFADSDDEFMPNFGEVLDQYADHDSDIVLFIPKSIKSDGTRSKRCDYYHFLFNQYINGKISSLELSYRLTNVWSKMYKRSAIVSASFEDTLIANDVQFAAQAAFYTRNNITVDKHNPIYILTEREGSITTTRKKKLSKIITRARIRMRHDAWFKKRAKKETGKAVRIRRYESALRRFIVRGDFNEEKRARWTLNPAKNILRVSSIMLRFGLAFPTRVLLSKHKKPVALTIPNIDIAYCVDENVVEQSLISLVSILDNNSISQTNAHFIHAGLSDKDLTFIASLQSRYTNLSIQLHKVNAKRLDGLFSRKYTKITPIGYGRFLFAEVLSALDKVLYLDTDVVCVGDISVLWNTELEGSYAAAVPEYSSWHSTGMTKSKEKARLFIAKENEMINSGVMLFNLDLIRKDGVVSKLFKTDKLIINRMNQDQDIYDVVFEGRIRKLPVVFNLTAINYMQNLTKIFSAVLIHYTGPNKPWIQKRGLKKFMSNLDLRQPYYSKYEKVLNHEN